LSTPVKKPFYVMAARSVNTESATLEIPEMSIGRLSEMKTTSLGIAFIVLPPKTL